MEDMIKYYTFYRENNNFDDILKDINLTKVIATRIQWTQHLMLGISNNATEGTFSYITLKYGDDIRMPDFKDFTPVAGVDYVPKKDKTKFTKSIR